MMLKFIFIFFIVLNFLNADDKSVLTFIEENQKDVAVYLHNKNPFHITCKINLELESKNLNDKKTILKSFDYNSKTKIATFPRPQGKFKIKSNYTWSLGTINAVHTSDYLYRLPYALNSVQMVTQGFNGKSTHFGQSQYAVDFDLLSGTKVFAARDGIVVKTKEDSNKSGPTKQFNKFANYITIRHPDNTYATYGHLKRNGVVVKVGQKVKRGQHIGYSGNTGYSTGAHLHFVVFKAKDHQSRTSLPIKFISNGKIIQEPIQGQRYKATN